MAPKCPQCNVAYQAKMWVRTDESHFFFWECPQCQMVLEEPEVPEKEKNRLRARYVVKLLQPYVAKQREEDYDYT
jgi:hypothetical protein